MPRTDFHETADSETGQPAQPCMHAGCREAGDFRAPAEPGRLRDYLWFCLEHVRAYNAAWDYYRGRSEAEIEADRRRADIWDRPTWRLGSGPGAAREAERDAEQRAHDFAGFGRGGGERQRKPAPRSERERALEELDLADTVDFAAIRRRYRELVKRLHPDANGGDRHAEERLKRVTQAYATLKALHA